MPPKPTPNAPLFQRIYNVLREKIIRGELSEHTALPSERVVAERYSVSRMTARHALAALEAEGLVYSEGRRGRFVSPKRLTYDVSKMVSFAADAKARGIQLEIEIIEAKTIKANAKLAQALLVEEEEPLHEYTRLFKVQDHAIFIETEFVIAAMFPDLLSQDLRQSTTQILSQFYNTHAHTGDIVIRMCGVRADHAGSLGLAANHAGIELEQVICDEAGRPFCFGQQVWRGELAQFSARAILNPLD